MKRYLLDLTERTTTAFAGALLAQLPAAGFDLRDVPWGTALSVAGGAALVVALTGVAARRRGNSESAGFTR